MKEDHKKLLEELEFLVKLNALYDEGVKLPRVEDFIYHLKLVNDVLNPPKGVK